MIKLGYSLALLVLISMVIPASAQNISDEDLKMREEILACFKEVDSDDDLTVAEKTVAKRNCETSISNKYTKMNNDHHDLAEQRDRIQTLQKCEDWYPSYKLLDEDQWRIQKHTEQATVCIILYNDHIWDYSGDDRFTVLSDRLIELNEKQTTQQNPIATSINLPSESDIVTKNTHDEITSLKAKVEQLQDELRKKDQVIMEQVKVITDLANMIKKVLFGAFLSSEGSF